jgi:hypothetical protein
MEGVAQDWYYSPEQNQGTPSWSEFIDRCSAPFGPQVCNNTIGALKKLCRTGTMEYKAMFLPMLMRYKNVSEPQQENDKRPTALEFSTAF